MRVLFAGGGTAGHINPALAAAGYLREKEPDAHILYVGNKGGMEERLVTRGGLQVPHHPDLRLPAQAVAQEHQAQCAGRSSVSFPASAEAKKIIKEFQPDICVGTGGLCGAAR